MAARPLPDLARFVRVFRNRNYAIYQAGSSISLIGFWVQRLGVGWLAWELTHSGFWLGAVAFADLFPVMVVGLFGGVLADRVEHRRILLVSQILQLAQATLLWLLTAAGVITIGWLFDLTLFIGVVVAAGQPARLSLVPSLARPEDLGSAVAIHSVIFNLARFVGPAIAGYIIHAHGVALAFAFNAITFVAFIVALVMLRLPPRAPHPHAQESFFRQMLAGLTYSVTHRGIAAVLLLMAATSFLVRPVFELLPGFADAVFHSGAGGLATLTAAIGLGALAAGLWLAGRASAARLADITVVAGGVLGAMGLVFALTSNLTIGAAALAVAGFVAIGVSVGTQTLVQTGVPGHMRGRVLSIWGMVLRGVPAAGALVMGWASDFLGLRAPLIIGSALCIAGAIVLSRWARSSMAALEQPATAPSLGAAAELVEADDEVRKRA